MITHAIISRCERYRYILDRTWDPTGTTCTFIMLNPSTADAVDDDPTIRRCISFAKREGCGSLSVVNLFAWRSTDPKAMFRDRITLDVDIVGADNDAHVAAAIKEASLVIAGWGAQKGIEGRVDEVARIAKRAGKTIHFLGTTKDGAPRHPLYLGKATPLQPWRAPSSASLDEYSALPHASCWDRHLASIVHDFRCDETLPHEADELERAVFFGVQTEREFRLLLHSVLFFDKDDIDKAVAQAVES